VAEADPSNLTAAVGVAESYSREGRHGEAVERYREILRIAPGRRDAQLGMAWASLGAGRAADAASWFDVALSQNRDDADALVGLGDARHRLGQRDEARAAYEEALLVDPDNEGALTGLRRLSERPSILEAEIWGGYTGDNGRDPGLRWAEARIYPAGGLELYGGYDDALNFRHPYLVRGRDDIRTAYGGLGYSYGEGRAYRTSFEFGRREETVDGTTQTTYTLDQTLAFGSGSWFRFGGWLGHWFDRDDWVVFAQTGLPAGSIEVKPVLSYGDYFGSGLTEVPEGVPNRAPAKEVRIGLHVRYDPEVGFGAEPGAAYGNVDSEASEELSGALWDATLRAWYKFGSTVALDSFFQYQAPPGRPSFWRVGLGLRFGVPRPN
jgi:tetratricopeptide (TPR) repeat protein